MRKRTNSIRSYCEMVSRKVEKGTCFRELSSKANMGLPVQFMKKKKKKTCRRPDLMIQEKQTKTI